MPAAVNNNSEGSGAGVSTITTGAVTPGGADRAVLVFNLSTGDTYATEAKYTDNSGALIDDYESADILLDLFSFAFAHAKAFGEVASPNTSTTIYNEWPGTPGAACAGVVFLEGVDQSDPLGTEEVTPDEFLDTSPETVSDTITGLTPGQLVIGALYVFNVGEAAVTSYAAAGDVEEIIDVVTDAVSESFRHVQIVLFEGHADGSGNYDPGIAVTWPNTGELVICRMINIPINDATGGGGLDETLVISGGVAISGTAPFTRARVIGVSGGVTISGSAGFRRVHIQPVSGGVSFGGTAPITADGATIFDITPSGGVSFAGTASPMVRGHVIPVSGGVAISGSAGLRRERIFSPGGGVTLSGTVKLGFTKTLTPSGGVTFGGTAPISFTDASGPGISSRLRMVGIGTMT